MGPPMVPPNTFALYGTIFWPCPRGKKRFASTAELRRYSYRAPWKSFVPDLMTTLVNTPAARPYSAGSVPISILISPTAPVDGTHGERYRPRPTFTVLDTPSTETSPVAGGEPLAVNSTLVPVSVGRVSSR